MKKWTGQFGGPYTGYGHMGGGFAASDMALESMKLFKL